MSENTQGVNTDFNVQLIYSLINLFEFYKDRIENGPLEGETPLSARVIIAADKEELNKLISKEVNIAMKSILDNLESGLSNQGELFNVLRNKILRSCNDAIRGIEKKVEDFYIVRIKDTQTKVVYRREG